MNRLNFEKAEEDNGRVYYNIINLKDEFLGQIKRERVGRFMHWCFVPIPESTDDYCYFSNGCLKEIVSFITSLYSKKT